MAAWAPLQAAARGINPIESAIRQELGLESTKLPDGVRQRVEAAIQRNRYRITIGEAAAMAGVKLSEAETALKALAYDSSAVLEVSSDGDVVYSFDPGFQAAIRNKSVSLRVKPALKKAGTWALLAVRIAFGTTLIASILTTFIAISIVLSSSQRQSDDRDGRGGGGSGFRMSFFPSDLFFYWTPNYQSRRAAAVSEGSMSLPEAIFSFVFGDGDPNMDYDEKRWRALGRLIQNRNGVLTAEEMAPYLDPKPLTSDGVVDESVVLPALIKFGGEPFVDEDGQLLYKFPTLQKTVVQREVLGRPAPRASAWAMRGARPVRGVDEFGDDAVLQPQYEQRWEMTAAEPGQIAATIALGLINFVGVAVLGGLISDPATRMSLIREGFSWIPSIVPFLTTYAVSFFGIPLVRYVRNSFFNKGIDERNDARDAAARRVAAPDSRLARKLAKARAQGERKVITQRDIVYSSEKDAGQTNARDLEDFDARLGSGRAVRDDTPWLNTNVTSKQPVGRTREEDGW